MIFVFHRTEVLNSCVLLILFSELVYNMVLKQVYSEMSGNHRSKLVNVIQVKQNSFVFIFELSVSVLFARSNINIEVKGFTLDLDSFYISV